ncbi:MAG TPA: SDR family NAD(P)-dependent oxidoreductase [Streptosporangiaceae bacterium]
MPDGPIRCHLTVSHSDFIMQNHRVHGVSVLPGVTLLDVVFRILRARGLDPAPVLVQNILFTEAVATAEGLDREVRVVIGSLSDGARNLTAESRPVRGGAPAGSWRRNLVADLVPGDVPRDPGIDIPGLKAGAERVRDMAEIYEQARRENIVHGPLMQASGRLYLTGGELLAELELASPGQDFERLFYLHPALLDASTLVAFARTPLLEAPFIPISIAAARAPRSLQGRCYVHVPRAETLAPSGEVLYNDYRIYDAAGQLVAEFTRLTCKRIRDPGLLAVVAAGQPPAATAPAVAAPLADGPANASPGDDGARLTEHIKDLVGHQIGIAPEQVSTTAGFYDQGLDSVDMLRISEQLEQAVGARLYPTLLFEFSDVGSLARHLAATYGGPVQPPRPEEVGRAAAPESAGPEPPPAESHPAELRAYRRVWRPAPVRPEEQDGDVLVLAVDEAAGRATAEALRSAGRDVTLALPGGEITATAAGSYRLGFSKQHLSRLLGELAREDRGIRTVCVVAAGTGPAASPEATHDAFVAVASAIVMCRPARPVFLCLVSVGNCGPVAPGQAAVGALARTLPAETPILHCRSIAIEDAADAHRVAVVVQEIADRGGHTEVRYRDGRREAAGLEQVKLVAGRPVPLRRNGVYLVTGGGGGLGRLLAAHLAERYDARLLLAGRGEPGAELADRLTAWRRAGAQVDYVQADVADLDGARAAVERARLLYGRLHGVFHLAGVVDDAVFFTTDPARTSPVLAPKLRGAVNLDSATAGDPLEVFVLFSSISAVLPNPGQSSYAYANAFLDHFAGWRERTGRPGRTVAIGWPYWADGGMRTTSAAVRHERVRTGFQPLPAAAGLDMLEAVLGAGEAYLAVGYGDPGRMDEALGVPLAKPGAEDRDAPAADIAIVGFAGRYPQAGDTDELWRNLAGARDAITEVPAERWDHQAIIGSKGRGGTTYCRWGGFIDGVDRFAPAFFGISRRDAERMDPQERLFLQACWHALEDAGYPPESLAGERVGVFAGVMWNHYQLLSDDDGVAPAALHSSVPNRVSYCFDFTGPSLAVDTACSSSLVALHLAVESIKSGDATMALAGGVNVTVHQQKYLQLAADQFLSEDGRCRAFGSGGTGYVPGEGAGVVVLKPLHRALAEGDHIDAVIRGSSVNHNGRTSGYTVPDPAAQAKLIRDAIDRSGVPAASISYIEAHGTGTSLGDPIEIEGLSQALAGAGVPPGSCAIGSVKSNIGHLESAAGIAGVTKVLLQMRHRELVPSLHAEELNPHIPFGSSPFRVQRQRAPWVPRGGELTLRAGVSAFGAGGANAHVIMESFGALPAPAAGRGEPELVILSAPDTSSLRTLARSLAARLTPPATGGREEPLTLCDIAFTLQVGRRPLPARLAVVVAGLDELRMRLTQFLEDGDMAGAGCWGVVPGAPGPAPKCGVPGAPGPAPKCDVPRGREELCEIARRWVGGDAAGWPVHAGPGRRVSLPVTPLPEEHCWLGAWPGRNAPASRGGREGVREVELKILEHGIALLVMTDDASRNMLTEGLLRSLEESFTQLSRRDDVKVVVLTGTERVFCMGGGPEALEQIAAKTATFTDAAFVYEGLLRCQQPVVAAVRGLASGGGLTFGLCADLVVMSREGGYSANFLKYGLTPGMGASYILGHRFGAALAAEMMLTGRLYRGDELERRGAEVLFEAAGHVLPAALDLARSMASMPSEALNALKAELARPILDRLPAVVAREVSMHDRVIGENTLTLVRQRFAKTSAATPAGRGEAIGKAVAPPGEAPADGVLPPQAAASSAAEVDRAAVVDVIEGALCAQLYAERHEIDHTRSLSEMGLDSIGAVEIVRDLNRAFGIDLDSVAVYDHPTVGHLANLVIEVCAERRSLLAAAGAAPAGPASPRPATAAPGDPPPDGPMRLPPPAIAAGPPGPPAPPRTITLAQLPDPPSAVAARPVGRADPPAAACDIAVVGMAGRWPGADDLAAFWENLTRGHSAIREVPQDRWDLDAVFDPDVHAEGKTYSRWAALLSDVHTFDHGFFSISPLEAEEMDPQQRLFLTEAWKALEDAGYAGETGEPRNCGVFVGCGAGDYANVLREAGRHESSHAFLGNSGSILAARIAYFLDLRGPAVAVDAACSSSLVAVHLACQSLRAGETDMALAGGVAAMLTPSLHVRCCRAGMLSPTGTSAPFDAAADGIVLGEGVGAVVLKRLADALHDRDHIHGVIKASGANGDGRTNGITAPSAGSQAALLRRVHAGAGVTPRDITYVEAHGTGTALGDPIEVKALRQVFGDVEDRFAWCWLGSVKGNIGHTTMAAGLAGLLKVLLALRHREVPPSANFTTVNPVIDFAGSPLRVNSDLRPWRPGASGTRIGAISSFGFSGTNCHVVVAEPPPRARRHECPARPELVPVSARTAPELDAQLRHLADALAPEHDLGDVAFTLALGRPHLAIRAAVLAGSIADLRAKLNALAAGEMPGGCAKGSAGSPPGQSLPALLDEAELSAAARAYVAGSRLDWVRWFAGRPAGRVPLPSYPFGGDRHCVAPGPAASPPEPTGPGQMDSVELHPAHPLVCDHQIGGRCLLPAAASVELVAAAAGRRGYRLPLRLSRLRWPRPFEVGECRTLAVTLTEAGKGMRYAIGAAGHDDDVPHGLGVVAELPGGAFPERIDLVAAAARCPRLLSASALYDAFDAAGLRYGPSLRLLRSLAAGAEEAVASIAAPSTSGTAAGTAVLDAAFQTIASLVDPGSSTPLLPVAAGFVEMYASLDTAGYAIARRRGRYQYDVDVTDGTGQVLVRVGDLTLRPADPLDGKVYAPVWRDAVTTPAIPQDGQRVAVFFRTGRRELAEALLGRLSAAEAAALPYDNDREPDLSALSQPLDCIYLLAAVGDDGSEPERDRGAAVLLRIVHALAEAGRADDAVTLKVVTDGAVATTPEETLRPHTAALVGLTRTVAAEYPAWRVGCVDVGTGNWPVDELAAALVAEGPAERLVALRPGRRLVRAFAPLPLAPAPSSPFRRRGVYLLLGGAGGIGSALSQYLARTVQARLVWVGRRCADDGIRRRAAAVAELGGEVTYLQADAANGAELAAALSEARGRFGRIDGAFHMAMTLCDRRLPNMAPADLDRVLAPKVAGAVNLHRALAGAPLDFLAVFSSAAALVDSAGQGNYAAASTFIDALALHLRRAGLPVTLFNWGYWGSVGAVATDHYRAIFAADGVGSIEPPMAMAALERALAAGAEQLLVIEATAAGLAHFGIEAGRAPQPAAPRAGRPEAADRIAHSTPPGPSAALGYTKRVFAEVLKFRETELTEQTTFEQFGVDSIVGSQILQRLEHDLGPLPATLLFEEMTLERLAARLLADRRDALASTLSKASAPPEPAARAPAGRAAAERTEDHGAARTKASGDIAIIGLAGRYPGAPDLTAFWRNLAGGVSSISEVPADRWDWRSVADPRRGLREYQRWGGFLSDVDKFDAALFGILPRDAVDIDPQERLFLETCWKLLEETGYLGELSHEPSTGVFAGLMYGTYGELGMEAWARGDVSGAHSAYWSIANRVSYTFDFQGPSLAVDSACSSSLTAVHLACESIRRGDCRMAIAGGVNLILHPLHLVALGARNMLASDGAVKVFDAAADGYVPGEGVGAALLKPLPDALADGDDVWAVVKATAINSGGKTSGYTVPNPNAQAKLIEDAIGRAGVEPATISYIETHGSGTELGDPIEVAGLARAFRSLGAGPARCAIGSVKSNIGHLEGAAGLAGLTKVLLQMRHGQLVPTISLRSLNPKIAFAETPFEPQRTLTEWARLSHGVNGSAPAPPRRAGVSSFGAGGTNVHIVVEECERAGSVPQAAGSAEQLFLLSAPDRQRLVRLAGTVADFLQEAPHDLVLAELAYTSQVGRRSLGERLAVVAREVSALARELHGFAVGGAAAGVIVGTAGAPDAARALLGDESGEAFADHLIEERDLAKLARAWTLGLMVDWRRLWPAPTPRRVMFPTTPFQGKRYWVTAAESGGVPRDRPAQARPELPGMAREPSGDDARQRTRMEYERAAWEPQPLGMADHRVPSVLVVSAEGAVGAAVAARLKERGIRCVAASRDSAQCPAGRLTGCEEPPAGIVYVDDGRLSPAACAADAGEGFHTVFRLAVDVLGRDRRVPLRVLCARVADGAGRAREAGEQPHLVALAGLLKTLVQESGCSGVCVALEPESVAVLAGRIADELIGGDDVDVAYEGGVRLVKKTQQVEAFDPATGWVSPDGAYLITGGAGGLGLHLAGLLSRRGAGEIVLAGRSVLQPGRAAQVAALAAGSTVVRYLRADVSSPAEADRLLAELRRGGRPLRGVIHAAGVIRDARAVNKTRAQLDEVLAPKVAGTLNLDRATAADPLDFFVMFSSIVGQTGNRGQADYAYANAFLDAFAETRERWHMQGRRRGKSLTIGWSLWRDGGMAMDDATAGLLRRRWGMVPITTRSGLDAFEMLLAGTELTVQAVGRAAGETTGPPAVAAPCTADAVRAPAAIAPGHAVLDRLRELAAGFLLVDPAEVDVHSELLEMGFDSISMTDLANRVNEVYGLELPPTVLFECPTLADLADHLAGHLEGHDATAASGQDTVEDAEPAGASRQPSRPDPGAGTAPSAGPHVAASEPAPRRPDVAVIGMAGSMPGSVDLDEFWRHLAAGDDLLRHVPADREELLADPRTRHIVGGFLDRIADFDAGLFGVAPREAALMDPQQRLFLQSSWLAIADAGYRAPDLAGTATGLFAGVSTRDYEDLLTLSGVPVEAHMATGLSHAVLANRVSHLLDLRGPSEAVDTACSSSLVAVHRAVRALRAGECDLALAGGVNVTLTPGLFVAFMESGMLSKAGRCRTFDAAADGYVRGEGVGAVLLKPLDRARADGDHVYAVIKGSAVNHSGRAASLTAPNPRAQAEVLAAAYRDAGVSLSQVSYLEAHGTGTRLGDPIEIEGIKKVLRQAGARTAPLAIASVKTNIGHLEAAAGIAGLLKVLLAMRHGQLPPHLHLDVLNPHITLAGNELVVNDRLRPWPARPVRLAGVSSFGFGGTNAHVVLADAPDGSCDEAGEAGLAGTPLVFVLSAPDAKRLAAYAGQLAARLGSDPGIDLRRAAYTLQAGRDDHAERLAVVAADREDVMAALRAAARGERAAGAHRGIATARGPDPATSDPHVLAAAWVTGAAVDWAGTWSPPPGRVPLPTFPLARTRHWFAQPAPAPPSTPAGSPPPAVVATQPPAPVATLQTAPVRARAVAGSHAIRDALCGHLADLLGIQRARIPVDQPFQRIGLDSIFAVDLAERLSKAFGRDVQAAELYEHDTIEKLAAFLGASAEPASAVPSAAGVVERMLEAIAGRPIDPSRSFVDNGFTSLDMLRAVGELEDRLGALPKTLLFDQPDLAALTCRLCELFGDDAVAAMPGNHEASQAERSAGPAPAIAAMPPADGAAVVAKRQLTDDPGLAATVADLAGRYGVESGLAGRDIAPLLFVGSTRDGYLEFAQTGAAVLAWSYTGSPHARGAVVAEFAAYARLRRLRVSVLSPTPIAQVAGVPFTATPFGVIQQLADLPGFSIRGGDMRRLRSALNRFAKAGTCEVVEYVPGTDAGTDASITELIDEWAAGKQTVNPYLATIREDMRRGRLPGAHRVFLTMLEGALVAVVVVTRMQAENGYLLDVEFYRANLAPGGLEHTIVEIIELLRAEGVQVFSFGATFGVRVGGGSQNASPAAEQALLELTSAGMTGAGNYRFKSKFRPQELPIYLCQPADEPTDVGVVLLMIATPAEPPGPAPAGAAPVREARLAAVGWNPLRLAHREPGLDLMTDSWTEREDPWVTERVRSLIELATASGGAIMQPWLPFSFVAASPSGRSAEAMLCRAWPGRRGVVLHNGLFPTWLVSTADGRFTPVPLVHEIHERATFGGDLPIPVLAEALARYGKDVSFVAVEPGSNSGGGRPMSLANLQEIKSCVQSHDLPLVMDATRIVENAIAITECQAGHEGRDPWDVCRDLLGLADAVTLSLSKDFGVDSGGLVASNIPGLSAHLREHLARHGTDVSLLNSRILQAALSDSDGILRGVRARIDAVRVLWQRLAGAGVPLVTPAGGHCVLLDVGRIAGLSGFSQPVAAYLAWIYRHTGIRGGPHLAGGGAHPELERCIRLAVPVGMNQHDVEQAGDRLAKLFHGDRRPDDLVLVAEPAEGSPHATYRLDGKPPGTAAGHPDWFRQQLRELGASLEGAGYQPVNQNLEVLREFCPAVECRMVEESDGDVEVFMAGQGPALVLMHPFNIGAGMFAPQLAGLADHFRIFVIHQPGVGRTRVSSVLSFEGLARLQCHILSKLGVDGPVHIGGASVGSIFAEYFALRFPESVRSLSLIGGSYKFANRKGRIDKLDQVIAEDFDMIISGTGSKAVAERRADITEALLRCESMDPHTGLRYLDLFAKEPDLTHRLAGIPVPTLIVHGRHDSVVGVKTGHFLHGAIPDARYVELPESGHFVCFTDAEAVNRELAAFLHEVALRPAGR